MSVLFFFFFQAEDGIRDIGVTGVQTCALPIASGPQAKRTSAIQFRWRRARRSPTPSPSKEIGARLSEPGSTSSSALTLTTACVRPSMLLVTTGVTPHLAHTWNVAVFVPNWYSD